MEVEDGPLTILQKMQAAAMVDGSGMGEVRGLGDLRVRWGVAVIAAIF